VQHTGIKTVSAAKHIDPEYAKLLSEARQAGVEIIVYNCSMSTDEIKINQQLSFDMS